MSADFHRVVFLNILLDFNGYVESGLSLGTDSGYGEALTVGSASKHFTVPSASVVPAPLLTFPIILSLCVAKLALWPGHPGHPLSIHGLLECVLHVTLLVDVSSWNHRCSLGSSPCFPVSRYRPSQVYVGYPGLSQGVKALLEPSGFLWEA